jgi:hypothetical protein
VGRLRQWYAPAPLAELAALHELVEACAPPLRLLLRAVHSSLVIKHSLRSSDTSAARVARGDRRKGEVIRAFRDRTAELARMLGALRGSTPLHSSEPRVSYADARITAGDQVDAVCTSPPYPATYDYVAQQQLRLAWLSASADAPAATDPALAQRQEIGSRRSFRASIDDGFARWARDTEQWVAAVSRRLRPGGWLCMLVGDGIAAGRLIRARQQCERAARLAELELVAAASVERIDPGIGLAKREHALVFARGSREWRPPEAPNKQPPRHRSR